MNILAQHNIYTIPAGDYFGLEPERCHIVYAPLANTFFLADASNINELEAELRESKTAGNPLWKNLFPSQERLQAIEPLLKKPTANELVKLFLILNERCNFACKYCYSAKGRSKDELTMETIRPMVDVVLGNARLQHKEPFIMFIGGGEPTLSWPLVEQTVDYALSRQQEGDLPISWSISTNGSILTEEMIALYLKHSFDVQLSFEVLPDVQDSQRGSFDKVAANLKRLAAAGVDVRIRSTITKLNVNRMAEMVRFCQEHFPSVRTLACEPVVDSEFLTTAEQADDFLKSYFVSFSAAREEAKKTGLAVRASASGSFTSISNYYCGSLFCLTPFGTITPCPDISSPLEEGYENQLYGKVIDGKAFIDNDAYQTKVKTGDEYPECATCFARWNCAGGCTNQRRIYPPDVFNSICGHTRRMLRASLLESLARRYEESTGNNFRQAMLQSLT